MRLSTSTNIHEIYGDDPYRYTIRESMEICAEAGYRVMDVNLHGASMPGGPLDQEDWEEWVEELGTWKERLGIEFSQGHAHFYTYPVAEEEQIWHEEMIRRSILAAGRLGVSWLVAHPYSVEDEAWYSHKKSLECNIRHMRRYAQIAEAFPGLGIAIENMVEDREKRRFGSSAEDLLELDRALDSRQFGLCWDFGHGERSGINQYAALMQMGKRLKATHMEDTNGLYFGCDHLLPYVGVIDWEAVMAALKAIGYEGDIAFEIHNFTRHMPPKLRKAAVRFSYEVGSYLLELAEGETIITGAKAQGE